MQICSAETKVIYSPNHCKRWDKSVTFLDVLIQLVNKRVQLLPLLGRKLKCIAGMNPLTQGAEIEETKMNIQAKIRPRAQSVKDEGGTRLPCADALSVGSHQSKQGEETLGDKPLQYNHTFIYWSTPEDYSFLQHRGQGQLLHHLSW